MKRSNFLIIILSASCFQACTTQTGNERKNGNDSIIVVKNADAIKDTSLKDTVPKLIVAAESGDTQFAVEAASGGMTEIALGKMAQRKAVDKRIRNFGALMVRDHEKANNKLAALAKAKNILLPFNPLAADQKVIDDLKGKSGKDFDKAYVNGMIQDHQNDIKVFENAVRNCQDREIKAFAHKMLPVLRNHLDAVMALHDGI